MLLKYLIDKIKRNFIYSYILNIFTCKWKLRVNWSLEYFYSITNIKYFNQYILIQFYLNVHFNDIKIFNW